MQLNINMSYWAKLSTEYNDPDPTDYVTSDDLTYDSDAGLQLQFQIHAGSTYTSGTLNSEAWNDVSNANRYPGIESFFSSTDNELYLTGVQLEVGEYTATTIPPFQHMNIAAELMRCFRYFEAHAGGHDKLVGLGGMYTGSQYDCVINTISEKRTTATLIVPDATNYFQIRIDNEVKTGDTIDTIGGRSFFKRQHLQIKCIYLCNH